jgi:hypothetical protein
MCVRALRWLVAWGFCSVVLPGGVFMPLKSGVLNHQAIVLLLCTVLGTSGHCFGQFCAALL